MVGGVSGASEGRSEELPGGVGGGAYRSAAKRRLPDTGRGLTTVGACACGRYECLVAGVYGSMTCTVLVAVNGSSKKVSGRPSPSKSLPSMIRLLDVITTLIS